MRSSSPPKPASASSLPCARLKTSATPIPAKNTATSRCSFFSVALPLVEPQHDLAAGAGLSAILRHLALRRRHPLLRGGGRHSIYHNPQTGAVSSGTSVSQFRNTIIAGVSVAGLELLFQ